MAVTSEQWTDVDRYLTDLLVPQDEALRETLRSSDAAGLPAINVSPTQGKLLHLLARLGGAKNVLEIGTLAGYSTIWLARALPAGGRVITLEMEPKHAEVARANFARAGLQDVIELKLGKALDTLPKLQGPFDLFFIDADKASIPQYFEWSLRLARPGSLIVVDNVVRGGEVANATSTDESVRGVRRLNELMAAEPRVSSTVIQTVGGKGYDGLAFALVLR